MEKLNLTSVCTYTLREPFLFCLNAEPPAQPVVRVEPFAAIVPCMKLLYPLPDDSYGALGQLLCTLTALLDCFAKRVVCPSFKSSFKFENAELLDNVNQQRPNVSLSACNERQRAASLQHPAFIAFSFLLCFETLMPVANCNLVSA